MNDNNTKTIEGKTENTAKRILSITISDDCMKAYARVSYIKDMKTDEYPPKFNVDEIMKIIKEKDIFYGVDNEAVKKLCEDEGENKFVIARGKEVVPSVDDVIKIEFEQEIIKKKDENEFKIDYRDVKSICVVQPGYVIAEIISGKDGEDGINIKNKKIKCAPHKTAKYSIAEGVGIQENKIVATIQGMPSWKNNIFSVIKVYEINGDINLSTGNIDFVGDVIVRGNIDESMELNAGNGAEVSGNIENAEVHTKGDLKVSGNIISSTITVGGEDIAKKNEIDVFNTLCDILEELKSSVQQLQSGYFNSANCTDGQIIKTLIEKKYSRLNKICMYLIKENLQKGGKFSIIVDMLKEKIIGLAPVRIKKVSELDPLIEELKNAVKMLSKDINLDANMYVQYAQNSTIKCSGDIVINGKGIYTSDVQAGNAIYCMMDKSVLRGGCIKAGNVIKSKIAGSVGRARTVLEVTGDGHIYADIAYANTMFSINGKNYILQNDSKNVHAYIGEGNLIQVDKFVL